MAPHATRSAAPSGWWHGHEPDVVASAADAFGLSIDALRLLSGLKAIGALLADQETAAWAGAGLTTAQGWVLAELVLIGPCPQHLIAQRLMVTPSSVSQVCTRLEHNGLVTRQPDPADRRVQVLTATAQAQHHVRLVVPDLRRALTAAEAALGPGGVRALIDHLTVLADSLSASVPASPAPEPSDALPGGGGDFSRRTSGARRAPRRAAP
jgi:DNA-binding MarR family transcriptional regulator